jgi:hypothetical protein
MKLYQETRLPEHIVAKWIATVLFFVALAADAFAVRLLYNSIKSDTEAQTQSKERLTHLPITSIWDSVNGIRNRFDGTTQRLANVEGDLYRGEIERLTGSIGNAKLSLIAFIIGSTASIAASLILIWY